ncbi:Protein dopey [Yarrowia sp. E02]|nr:Protein dopey [Yarrowia sp. E02]
MKKYTLSLERALALWDSVDEWADYISFIGKLQKALKSHSNPSYLPLQSEIASKLAWCLLPNLPSGVHQKTLEVYRQVFEILRGIGEYHKSLDGKSVDPVAQGIRVWLPGLLPLMAHASINVKPILIEVLQKDIVEKLPQATLKTTIRPLLLSLLPGIDDESSESFQACFDLIQKLKLRLHDEPYFWQCFFLTIVSAPDKRQGALIYAYKELPQFSKVEGINESDKIIHSLSYEAQSAVSPESGLLIRAFCRGLEDDQLLVQRGFLELLVKNLPLNSPVITDLASKSDVALLMTSACAAVLRKDMSLNRRLWAWLLGPDDVSMKEYFTTHGRDALVKGILALGSPVRASKISLSLMDRWEIGTTVIPEILTPIIQSVYDCEKRPDYQDIVLSASAFVDSVEAINIWADIQKMLKTGSLSLALFTLQTFNLSDEEMIVKHAPLALLTHLLSGRFSQWKEWNEIASLLIELVPERAFLPVEHSTLSEDDFQVSTIETRIADYYNGEGADGYGAADVYLLLLQNSTRLADEFFKKVTAEGSNNPAIFSKLALIISELQAKQVSGFKSEQLEKTLKEAGDEAVAKFGPFSTSPLPSLPPVAVLGWTRLYSQFPSNLLAVVGYIFTSLTPNSQYYNGPFHNAELVKALWNLQAAHGSDDREVEAALSILFSKPCDEKSQVFSAIWQHSLSAPNFSKLLARPLFLYLDLLPLPTSQLELYGSNGGKNKFLASDVSSNELISLAFASEKSLAGSYWLNTVASSGSCGKLFSLLLDPLSQTEIFSRPVVDGKLLFEESDDLALFAYHVSALTKVLSANNSSMAKFHFNQEEVEEFALNNYYEGKPTYATWTINLMAHFLQFQAVDSPAYSSALSAVLKLCSILLDSPLFPTSKANWEVLVRVLVTKLSDLVNQDSELQVIVLAVLAKALQASDLSMTLSKSEKFIGNGPVDIPLVSETSDVNIPGVFIAVVLHGLSSRKGVIISSGWIHFLECLLGIYSTDLFQISIAIVERLCLEYCLETLYIAYTEVEASQEELNINSTGWMTNVVNGVLSLEEPTKGTGYRMIVLLCFQNAVNSCFNLWQKVDGQEVEEYTLDSVVYLGQRLKFRARKILDKLFSFERGEVLQMLIERSEDDLPHVLKVLHVLDGSRPKLSVSQLLQSLTDDQKKSTAFFLLAYVESLSNDAVEDIYSDYMGFARTVMLNPVPYKEILSPTVQTLTVIGVKIDGSNFANRKVCKEISDAVVKLVGQVTDEQTLIKVVPKLRTILIDQDKVSSVLQSIISNVVIPKRSFELLGVITQVPGTVKVWKNAVHDFFIEDSFVYEGPWPQILSKWSTCTKEVSELITGSSGVFNWGSRGNSVRRLCYLLLSGQEDQFVLHMKEIKGILDEIELESLFIALRAIVMRFSATHLVPIWPLVAHNLQVIFEGLLQGKETDNRIVMSACKLLDLVLVLNQEDFQLDQWLFVTDSSDAIYGHPYGILDQLAESTPVSSDDLHLEETSKRRPLLFGQKVGSLTSLSQLKPFFDRLSIYNYESVYALKETDEEACEQDLLADIQE